MRIAREELELEGSDQMDVHELSGELRAVLERSGIRNGTALVFTPGSTAGVTTIEFESGAVNDLKRALDRIAPRGAEYEHDLRWGDGNGYSHLRSALLGPSLTVPVVDGALALGTWQQIIVCDFDNRPRRRRVILQIHGE